MRAPVAGLHGATRAPVRIPLSENILFWYLQYSDKMLFLIRSLISLYAFLMEGYVKGEVTNLDD